MYCYKTFEFSINCCWLLDCKIQYIYQCLNISIAKGELRYLSIAPSRGFSEETLTEVE